MTFGVSRLAFGVSRVRTAYSVTFRNALSYPLILAGAGYASLPRNAKRQTRDAKRL
jgi:hypothetical protein